MLSFVGETGSCASEATRSFFLAGYMLLEGDIGVDRTFIGILVAEGVIAMSTSRLHRGP